MEIKKEICKNLLHSYTGYYAGIKKNLAAKTVNYSMYTYNTMLKIIYVLSITVSKNQKVLNI